MLPSLVIVAAVTSTLGFSSSALAGQGTVSNPPPALRPGTTSTVHEIGASFNGAYNPDAFMPAFNWRFHLPQTGRMGPLSGLYMGFNVGPAVHFRGYGYGRGRGYYGDRYDDRDYGDRYYRDRSIWGVVGFELGYEFAPWSNLALTFSPVVHNDFHFSPYFFQFAQTFGPAVRLYLNQHWVVYFEPGAVGWNVWTHRDRTGGGLSARGAVGFAYKF